MNSKPKNKLDTERWGDPEASMQERFNLLVFVIFHLCGLLAEIGYGISRLKQWFTLKKVCAWHEPKPMRMAGNPFAWRVTHGICDECSQKALARLFNATRDTQNVLPHGAPDRSKLLAGRSETDRPFLQAPSAELLGGRSVGRIS